MNPPGDGGPVQPFMDAEPISSGDGGAVLAADAAPSDEAGADACMPIKDPHIPPGNGPSTDGLCCVTSSDCYVDAGIGAGLDCPDAWTPPPSVGPFICCQMGHCLVVIDGMQ